jgi:L-lysine exporter family protein LysE/ArgO
MTPEVFLFLLIGFFASVIGAVPFGLVNLSVLQTAISKGIRATMPISYGASVIEILYGTLGIFVGAILYSHIENNVWFHLFTSSVLLIMGWVFIRKRSQIQFSSNNTFDGFLYGVLLNLLSLQVLAYWILAISFIVSVYKQIIIPEAIIPFLMGIFMGKMGVLISYAFLGKKIIRHSEKIAQKINQIIGFVLIVIGLFALAKYFFL